MTPSDIEKLRGLSNSPYPPEPPRKSIAVDLAMRLAQFLGRTGLVTPHLSGGSNDEKVAYEYRTSAEAVWDELSGLVDPSILKGKDVLDAGWSYVGNWVTV